LSCPLEASLSPYNNPLLFVIPSVPGFPAPPLSPATPDVVLFKENHTQPTEAAILDRKSGEGEESAVRRSGAPNLPFYNYFLFVVPRDLQFLIPKQASP
jgi:hypothetical protein